jgi:hypothetical protein
VRPEREKMPEEAIRVFPRSSAFEALLSKVYLELWELQDNPVAFASRVNVFASYFLPSMFQDKVMAKSENLTDDLTKLNTRVKELEDYKKNVDPFTEDAIRAQVIPQEEAEFAMKVWHKIVDVLTDAGFNFPVSKSKERRQMRA